MPEGTPGTEKGKRDQGGAQKGLQLGLLRGKGKGLTLVTSEIRGFFFLYYSLNFPRLL